MSVTVNASQHLQQARQFDNYILEFINAKV